VDVPDVALSRGGVVTAALMMTRVTLADEARKFGTFLNHVHLPGDCENRIEATCYLNMEFLKEHRMQSVPRVSAA